MADFAVLASGSGTNFQKLAEFFRHHPRHRLRVLICDRKDAGALVRARDLGIEALYIPYFKREKEEAEAQITEALEARGISLVVLAGFMRLLSETFTRHWQGRLVNIHPALLPRHPGAHGIADSFQSGDAQLGVTVHWVDEGMDTGPIIRQKSFTRTPDLTLEDAERLIHALEYELYPQVVLELLSKEEGN